MENEHVLSCLTRKRAEIAGQIEHAQDALRKLVISLDAMAVVVMKRPGSIRPMASYW